MNKLTSALLAISATVSIGNADVNNYTGEVNNKVNNIVEETDYNKSLNTSKERIEEIKEEIQSNLENGKEQITKIEENITDEENRLNGEGNRLNLELKRLFSQLEGFGDNNTSDIKKEPSDTNNTVTYNNITTDISKENNNTINVPGHEPTGKESRFLSILDEYTKKHNKNNPDEDMSETKFKDYLSKYYDKNFFPNTNI